MALLGARKRLFPDPDDIRPTAIGMQQEGSVMPQQPTTQVEPQKRFKPNILGVIGDAMQVFGGGQATYMQGIQAEQARAQMMRDKAAQMQSEREYDWQDWTRKQDYERQNPAPANNDTVNDLNWYKGLSDDDRKLYHQMKPTVSYRADGTPFVVNPYDLQGGAQNPPQFAGWPDDEGGSAPQARGNFPVSYDQFKKAIIQQESGGRYGVANGEGSGAMGIGQIMPDTAKALAAKLGLPYRPDLLAGDGDQARRYQDAITEAAVKEAWQYSGGKDPRTSAQYYFAGPNKKGWGPKTRKYGEQVLGRIR